MAGGLGMRGKAMQTFCQIAKKCNIYILVRQTNPASLAYVGKAGYYPNPAAVKAKTVDEDPPMFSCSMAGRPHSKQCKIAGLVPHPGLQPGVFKCEKLLKAQHYWLASLDIAMSSGSNNPATDLNSPQTWAFGGKDHASA